MPSITIRNLDLRLKSQLRIRAAHHGRSMEEEAHDILRSALSSERPRHTNLAISIRERFAPFGGFELPETKREGIRPPVNFGQ